MNHLHFSNEETGLERLNHLPKEMLEIKIFNSVLISVCSLNHMLYFVLSKCRYELNEGINICT